MEEIIKKVATDPQAAALEGLQAAEEGLEADQVSRDYSVNRDDEAAAEYDDDVYEILDTETIKNLDAAYEFNGDGLVTDVSKVTTRDEAKRLWHEGKLTDEQVRLAGALITRKDGGLLGLSLSQGDVLADYGLLTTKEAKELLEYQESPFAYYAKGIFKQTGGGVLDAFQAAKEFAIDAAAPMIASILNPIEAFDYKKHAKNSDAIARDLRGITGDHSKLIEESSSQALSVLRDIVQFAAGYGVIGKAATGNAFMHGFGQSLAVGAATDMIAFKGDAANIGDLLKKFPALEDNAVVSFLAGDLSDGDMEKRAANALSGVITGAAFQATISILMAGLKGARANIWARADADEQSLKLNLEEVKSKIRGKDETRFKFVPQDTGGSKVFAKVSPDELAALKTTPRALDEKLPMTERIVDEQDFETLIERNIKAVKNEVRTHKEVEEVAEKYGVDMDDFRNLLKDTRELDARIVGVGRALKGFEDDLIGEVKRYKEAGIDDAVIDVELFDKITQFGRMQGAFYGSSKEIARALNAHKLVKAGRPVDIRTISKEEFDTLTRGEAGRQEMKRVIDDFYKASLQSTGEAARIARASTKSSTESIIETTSLSGLLSNYGTHAVNLMGNIANVFEENLLHLTYAAGKAVIGDPKELMRVKASFAGQMVGIREALGIGSEARFFGSRAGKAFLELRPQTDIDATAWIENASANVPNGLKGLQKFDEGGLSLPMVMKRAYRTEKGGLDYKAIGMEALGLPVLRFLTAVDEVFKSAAYKGELYRLAQENIERGRIRFKDAAQKEKYLKNFIEKARPNVREVAIDQARRMTFTAPITVENEFKGVKGKLTSVGNVANHIVQLINKGRNHRSLPVRWAFKLGFRFLNTPTNIAKEALRHTPAAALSRRFWQDMSAGGHRKAIALQKVFIGSTVLSSVGLLYGAGAITGSIPKNERERYRLLGIPEYAIRFGDTWYQYNKIEPLGTVIGLAANAIQMWDKTDADYDVETLMRPDQEAAAAALLAIGDNVSAALEGVYNVIADKSYLKGFSDMSQMFGSAFSEESNADKAGKAIGRALASFAPWSSAVRGAYDGKTLLLSDDEKLEAQTQKEGEGFIENLLNYSVRALSDDLPVMLDVLGEPVTKMPKLAAITHSKDFSADAVRQELYAVGYNGNPLKEDKYSFKGVKVELDAKERNKIKEIVRDGLGLKGLLAKVIQSKSYQRIEDYNARRAILSSVISGAYSSAKAYYLTESGDEKAAKHFRDVKRELLMNAKGLADAEIAETLNRPLRVGAAKRKEKESIYK